MLGRFLEFSLPTPDIRASLDFYTKLGFSQAAVGDAWPHPYAVVTDGRVCLGLHQDAIAMPAMTFVKPGLLQHLETLEKLGLELQFRRLGNDVFNEVGWLDPGGMLVRLIEARTFSPNKGLDASRCGYFLEIALPTRSPAAAKADWERFGFVGIDETDDRLPHVSCTSDTIDVGLYDPAHLRRPTLRFEVDDVEQTLERLAEAGIETDDAVPPPLRQTPAALMIAPEGTPLLLTEAAGP